MVNLAKRIGGALKDAAFQMFGLHAVFGPGTGGVKKAAIREILKNAIGIGELALAGSGANWKPHHAYRDIRRGFLARTSDSDELRLQA